MCGSDDNLSPHRESLLSGDMARPIWSIPWLQTEDHCSVFSHLLIHHEPITSMCWLSLRLQQMTCLDTRWEQHHTRPRPIRCRQQDTWAVGDCNNHKQKKLKSSSLIENLDEGFKHKIEWFKHKTKQQSFTFWF